MAAGPSRDPRIGTVLKDKWKVDARLGRGGVATVYAATHRNGNRVAIKMLNREVARNPDIRSRFLREGYAANAVAHPGVVRVLDDDTTEEGQPFLVMELLEGELVDEWRMRKGGRLALGEVLRVGDQVLDVLAAAHEKGIIHRDIKPENIFLCTNGAVRVLDFGIAHMRQAAAGEFTATGMLLGTPEFMSPEQANGIQGDVDKLTDIWATGATLFTLLSGEAVHEASTTTAQILAAVTTPARSLAKVAPEVPRAIVEVIDRALAFDKRARWPDARSMQRALAAAGRGLGTASSSHAPAFVAQGAPVGITDDGPLSEEETMLNVGSLVERALAPVSEAATTKPKPPIVAPIEDEATTVAQREPPVVIPSTLRLGPDSVGGFGGTQRSSDPGPPISEDLPTRVSVRALLEEPPMRAAPRAPLHASQTGLLASPHNSPSPPPPMTDMTAVLLRNPIASGRGPAAPQPAPPQLAQGQMDRKGRGATTRRPIVPISMGGFILKPRAAQSETPTAPTERRAAAARSWGTLVIAVAVGTLLLWLVLVIVLRALFR